MKKSAYSYQLSATGHRGFTLIETLVAISVLLLSLAGPLTLAAQALSSAYYARDQITAFYLAQEAVEYVRAKRDQNYLASPIQPWLNGLDDCVGALCNVDFPNFTHTVCTPACPELLYNNTTGIYNTLTGSASGFRRELTIIPITADEVSLRVRVYWQSGTLSRTFEIRENIFNWLQ
jgi:prepilin-type N-terminal cleavage/methylation domain-containing protein